MMEMILENSYLREKGWTKIIYRKIVFVLYNIGLNYEG